MQDSSTGQYRPVTVCHFRIPGCGTSRIAAGHGRDGGQPPDPMRQVGARRGAQDLAGGLDLVAPLPPPAVQPVGPRQVRGPCRPRQRAGRRRPHQLRDPGRSARPPATAGVPSTECRIARVNRRQKLRPRPAAAAGRYHALDAVAHPQSVPAAPAADGTRRALRLLLGAFVPHDARRLGRLEHRKGCLHCPPR